MNDNDHENKMEYPIYFYRLSRSMDSDLVDDEYVVLNRVYCLKYRSVNCVKSMKKKVLTWYIS